MPGVKLGFQFSIVPVSIMEDERVDKVALLVYLALVRFASKDGTCYPSLATIAKVSRCAKSTVQVGIDSLVSLGYLSKASRVAEDGALESNVYTILAPTPIPATGIAPTDERYTPIPAIGRELDLSEPDTIHTSPVPEETPTASPRHEVPGLEYPKILLREWNALGSKAYQPANEIQWLTVTMPKALPMLRGVHSDAVLGAIRNYATIIFAPPGRYYWDSRLSFDTWVARHLEKFLPENFKAADFESRARATTNRSEPVRPPLLETYEPIPEENLRPPTEAELEEVAALVGDGRPRAAKRPA